MRAAGLEIQPLLRSDHLQHIVIVELGSALGRNQVFVVDQSTGVGQQIEQRDLAIAGRQFGQPLAHRVFEPQFAVLFQQEDAGRGELLGDRCEAVVGFRAGLDMVFQIRVAEAAPDNGFAVLHHEQRRARPVAGVAAHQAVDTGAIRRCCRLRMRADGEHQPGQREHQGGTEHPVQEQ